MSFNIYLEPWLIDAIVSFQDFCTQDLTYTTSSSSVEGGFTENLTLEHKVILSRLMVLSWLAKTIREVTQMQLFIQDRDFKTHSAAQNLTAKQEIYKEMKEEISNLLVYYGFKNTNWDNWDSQIFR